MCLEYSTRKLFPTMTESRPPRPTPPTPRTGHPARGWRSLGQEAPQDFQSWKGPSDSLVQRAVLSQWDPGWRSRGWPSQKDRVLLSSQSQISRISFQASCARPDVDQFPIQVAARPWVRAEASVQWGAGEQAGAGPVAWMGLLSAFPMEPTSQTVHGLGQNSGPTQSPWPSEPTPSPLAAVSPPPQLTSYCLIFVIKFKVHQGISTRFCGWMVSHRTVSEAGRPPSPEPGGYSGVTRGLSLAVTPVQ